MSALLAVLHAVALVIGTAVLAATALLGVLLLGHVAYAWWEVRIDRRRQERALRFEVIVGPRAVPSRQLGRETPVPPVTRRAL